MEDNNNQIRYSPNGEQWYDITIEQYNEIIDGTYSGMITKDGWTMGTDMIRTMNRMKDDMNSRPFIADTNKPTTLFGMPVIISDQQNKPPQTITFTNARDYFKGE